MRKQRLQWMSVGVLTSGVAFAQTGDELVPPSEDGQLSTEGSVQWSSEGEEPQAQVATQADAPAPPAAPKPPSNYLEIGVFGGALFPSPGHNLLRIEPQRDYRPVTRYELGGRIGYYPISEFGIEVEGMHARGAVRGANGNLQRADFNAYRGQLVGQLPLENVTPFLVLGGGVLQALSLPQGGDTDAAAHAGIGIKVGLTRDFAFRAEVRENVTDRGNDRFGGFAFHEEVLIGFSGLIGVAPAPAPEPPPPPADRDRDTVPDASDACPDVPALTADGCPADTDGDGVNDLEDQCIREAGLAPTGCPDLDQDEDGVKLPCDLCPSDKGVGPDGCPVRDSDGDGIFDDKDKCPKQPETFNGHDDADGCPDEVPKEVQAFTGAIEGIQFEVGSSKIRATSSATLGKAAAVLIKYPSIRLEIAGHTSSEGGAAMNDQLSADRASSVKEWLVNAGVDSARLTTRGAGSNEPVADNATDAGRRKNRRIEFKLLNARQ